jgi:hypothetical protein
VARRAMNLHGCAPASRAPFPQIPAFEARCIRPGIVPLPHRSAVGTPRSGASPVRRIDPLGARPLRERNPGSRPHCAPRYSYSGGTPAARSSYRGAPPPAATPPGASANRHRETRDTGHRWIFAAYGTARKSHCGVQALSGDIPGVNPGCREGVSHAHNPQTSITRCRRFQGTYLARGGHSWFNPGWREGVSSHCGKVCPLPTTHNHKVLAF